MYRWRDVWRGGGIFRIRTVFNFMQTNLECCLSEAVSREVEMYTLCSHFCVAPQYGSLWYKKLGTT